MAKVLDQMSHTFSEYLLLPGYSDKTCTPENVSLHTPLVKHNVGERSQIELHVPLTSAIMQSVSGPVLACALAQQGGLSFIYGSQTPEQEAAMVKAVKDHKAGVVLSDSNVSPTTTLSEVLELKEKTGHSAMPVTSDGTPHGKLLGIVTGRDYRVSRDDPNKCVSEFMTPIQDWVCAPASVSLSEANDIIWEHKLNQLPLIEEDGTLVGLVFRKDYDAHKTHPHELLDEDKRYLVGAGINTRDYKQRVPLLLDAGADVLCIDSSEGYSAWQQETISWIKETYGDSTFVGAGNVVDGDGFRFLADAGADFIKVGIGGGSICITREQKGIGRGQASALLDVCTARDAYAQETGIYIPVCSDGGIVYDYHMTLALAMGADFLMLGRYFARFDEAPSARVNVGGSYMKEYWGEGSKRARNWARYDLGSSKKSLSFVEGVDSYVPYAGSLEENVAASLLKITSTMCNCGAHTIKELNEKAQLTLVSATSLVEGGAHDVVLKETAQQSSINFG